MMQAAHPRALLTTEQMGQVDAAAIQSGVPGPALMDAAGLAVARVIVRQWQPCQTRILCGPGNNGGDGLVVARYLQTWGWPVKVAVLGEPHLLSPDAAHHLALWPGPVEPFEPAFLDGAQLVVDAVFGAGLSRPPEGRVLQLLEKARALRLPVCAIDTPTGVDGTTGQVAQFALQAQHTVTFVRKKPGHVLLPGRQLCGQLHLADIGVPAGILEAQAAVALENHPGLWLHRYPWPEVGGHKYDRGHVLLAGGALMTGAARLAAVSAARVGAGLVTVAAPSAAWPVYAASLLSTIVLPLEKPGQWEALLDDERKNVVVVGPGAGSFDGTRQQVLSALQRRRAMVIDADGLSAFRSSPRLLFDALHKHCVLTPHEGEFARLFPHLASGQSAPASKIERVRMAAQQSGAVVLLKGADTVIASPAGLVVVNSNAPATLATAGTGDVLAGLVAGLLAQGLKPVWAAAAAAWLHGEAATLAGPGLIAEDLPALLPHVLKRLWLGQQQVHF